MPLSVLKRYTRYRLEILEIQREMTKETIRPDICVKRPACTKILIENELGENALHSNGRNVYMVPFFNLLYYLGYFPIKFHFDKEKDKYFIKTHRVQKVSKLITQAFKFVFTIP